MAEEQDLYDEILAEANRKMARAVEVLERDLTTIRTGRASGVLVERLPVEYYGTPLPLNQLAGIHIPEPRLIVIQPWDKNALPAIEKAIRTSDLGLNPANDGNVLRLAVPPLTEERRRELVRLVHRRVEEARVAVRNCRREAHEDLRLLRKEKEITEDDLKRGEETLQKTTDRYIAEAERLGRAKEAEVLEV